MKSRLIKNHNFNFIEIELVPILQKEKSFFFGKVLAKDLLHIYTVRPAKYDSKKHSSFAKSFEDDKEYYEYLVKQDEERIAIKDFQREPDKSRINKIAKFLEDEEFPFFPNTIIATCDLINDIQEFGISFDSTFEQFIQISNRPAHLSFLKKQGDDKYILYIPFVEHSVLVIDGQHRLKGLETATAIIQENFELLISFIIGFDRSVIAQLFYTINYEQKSVNKSLLYHLTGEFSSELDELTFMHNVVKILNELENSPFHGKIKMLGINPKEATSEMKEKLTISQAFLIDYLIRTISATSINSYSQPIFLYYYKNKELQIEIIRFLIRYFNAIREIKKNDWDNPSTNILTKGIGIAALIKVLHFLFVKMFIDEWDTDPLKLASVSKEDLIKKLDGLLDVDFSKEGEFGGAASGGSINKLSQRIIEKVKYFSFNNYKEFFENYKSVYLPEFKEWIKNKIS
ncbi:MAG: DGQHR domain-containing protein [Candidatus Brocadia sp. AMX2]|uniref:DGQHR domain-containing protein n=1 Tax=Candidatus Brocadia sp. AMX2 TaxID=2293635 RepID=UPI000EEE6D01|nr:DGQHR domain-containing protein [Candidatus Brocadia sp. AMX2]MBC6930714.1 DGQHR domain-containing protein [Candidatus Brocadia sp.]KAA0245643.1 MAG: DGQHR domain-containing protein [Candidatus Brocadia sp. AMX2]MCE7865389.1 DGQHR domain-containing protein [Candidatus Brocadia sp. AMX2]MCQ3915925.1 hypothetical protein [Candidatus Brocadia sp.]MDL1934002.1 DGQHR domain-containing protein [Candidatus Brocadia sp. AMX2]